jgi:uncharacterized membrane protein
MVAVTVLSISLFFLISKVSRPSEVRIVLESNSTRVEKIPNLYTSTDMILISFLSLAAGGSAVYLLSRPTEEESATQTEGARRNDWEKQVRELHGNERTVYESIMSSEGVAFQTEIIKGTGLSSGTVSILLSRMEARGIIEKRRSGMQNLIMLK